VIGVDDIAVRPALTTIRIDRQQMGARAVEMVMQLRGDPDGSPRRETVEVQLVRRESA
jgi:DNA-binding LacI/PurR family transcriptional regulator